jgi:hypothetical protein
VVGKKRRIIRNIIRKAAWRGMIAKDKAKTTLKIRAKRVTNTILLIEQCNGECHHHLIKGGLI